MEKSRAIELLKLAVPIKALTHQEFSDFVEAVNMGMDALEQPTSPDTIDRKAALDALRRCQTYLYDARDPELKIELSSAEAAINNLPTIQPEKAQLSQEGTTSDLISRQAAIDALQKCRKHCIDPFDSYHIDIQDAENQLSKVPTVQPERKKGEWIEISSINHTYKCSECGRLLVNVTDGKNNVSKHYPYCHCGADMKGERQK